jgi:hypothetical protein
MAKGKVCEVIPSASRLINTLRDAGYDFSSAVADIVDNSIEAGATLIDIKIEFNGDDSWVRISDNGSGMNSDTIIEAMRYGSQRKYGEDELGKFGVGLKTSSLSQCRFFAVASRFGKNKKIEAYSWDLSYVELTDKWCILPIKDERLKSLLFEPLKKSSGTVVLWRQLDRILGYKHPYGENARKHLNEMTRDLEQHLAMVFHRFLSGNVQGKKKIIIKINGIEVEPWDPFVRSEEKTQVLTPIKLTIEHEGKEGVVQIEQYILPHEKDFSSLEKFKLAAGPSKWNQQQGFYIYRSDRMIQSGGWCRLRAPDEHTKLARIALSFSPVLDEAFKINFSKMRVELPNEYREAIAEATQNVVRLARETYDRKERRNANPENESPSPSIETLEMTSTNINESDKAHQFWTLDEIEVKILSLAKSPEKLVIKKVFDRLRRKLGI